MSGEKQVGNVAAMREALVAVKKSIDGMGISSLREALEAVDKALSLIIKSAWFVDANFNETIEVMDAGKKIESALALPLRNCDVGTVEEQDRRATADCRRWGSTAASCHACPCYKWVNGEVVACRLVWAQMPYTEEGGAS